MAKTWRQILDEMGKVPPEQSMKDEAEWRAEKGPIEASKEYLEVAQEKMHERFIYPGRLPKK